MPLVDSLAGMGSMHDAVLHSAKLAAAVVVGVALGKVLLAALDRAVSAHPFFAGGSKGGAVLLGDMIECWPWCSRWRAAPHQ